MRIGLVGYQGTGKSSLFELLTGVKPDPAKVHTGQSGMASIPDRRFDGLVAHFKPKKITPAKMELLDTPGLAREHSDSNSQRISVVREANALVHVIGVFSGADPLADANRFEEDLTLADMQVVNNRIDRLKAAIGKRKPDKEASEKELALLEPIAALLNDGSLLRDVEFTADQEAVTRSFSLLTRKQVLLVLNTADARTDDAVIKQLADRGYRAITAPAGIELELAALDPAERAAFAADYGITESSHDRLLRALFDVTGLIAFYTSDEKEVRAWLLKRGSTALDAAGTIHSDLARGFIRAEIMAVDDLLRLGSEREVKAHNLYHVVGRDHVVQDGDEIVIRFNV